MEDELEGEPQLLCECEHGGDVLDLQVGSDWSARRVASSLVDKTGSE